MAQSFITPPGCPLLPRIDILLPSTHTRQHRDTCGEAFYSACHELAQSHWLRGRPAQAILQLDKAMMAKLPADSEILKKYPIPYEAILWIIQHSSGNDFLGNPVRHFQHLASRMNQKQPQPELRRARAWCCLHLSEQAFGSATFPRDLTQVQREQLHIPSFDQAITMLENTTPHSCEVERVQQLAKKRNFMSKKDDLTS